MVFPVFVAAILTNAIPAIRYLDLNKFTNRNMAYTLSDRTVCSIQQIMQFYFKHI